MTSERARAYGRVMKTLDDLGATKLHASEQAVVREAADALLFSERVDDDIRAAIERLDEVLDRLVEAERLLPETARALGDDVEDCGPPAVPAAA